MVFELPVALRSREGPIAPSLHPLVSPRLDLFRTMPPHRHDHANESGRFHIKCSFSTDHLLRQAEFEGAPLYFHGNEVISDVTFSAVRDFTDFFKSMHAPAASLDPKLKKYVVPVDLTVFQHLAQMPEISELPTFRAFFDTLSAQPETMLQCMCLAAHQVIHKVKRECQFPYPDKPVIVRLKNFDPKLPMKCLKSNVIGRMIAITGTVVRVGIAKSILTEMQFACAKCGTPITCHFANGIYQQPTRCAMRECRGKTFNPLHETAVSVDWQKIRVQEIITDYEDSGRIPRTVDCELFEDLVDACAPGDIVTVTGIVKVASVDEGGGRFKSKKKESKLFTLYLVAHGLQRMSDQSRTDAESHQFTDRELQAIHKIASQPNLFSLLVQSLCPPIFGHEMIKAGFILALFGGTPRQTDPKSVSIRSDIHMLVVGDPGLGKSQMLRSVASVSPRGVYVSGRATTSSGLTVTVVKEGNDFALEAGALVMGDRGSCCIDEFDKMGNEHQALLEAMEQQTISIAKGGLVCSLRAQTSVLAAANPVGGHYNRAKTVSENLKISPMILSRFDLVFILLDEVDEEKDMRLSEHLMSLFAGAARREAHEQQGASATKSLLSSPVVLEPTDFRGQSAGAAATSTDDAPLATRLAEKSPDPIPHFLLRKYIAYCKQQCHPQLTDPAREVLRNFYLSLRRSHHRYDSTPITTRQLESLVRLSEARAKCELREQVTEKDALDVVAVLKESLYESLADENGRVDFTRSTGMSKSKEVNCLCRALNNFCNRQGQPLLTMLEIQTVAADIGIKGNVRELVERMNNIGLLLKRANNVYKFTGAGMD
ncbi:putative DNA helicase MCM8 [Paratrimastix pyriformis]|uniref:DNA helicase MCM8 n=1 Tax=Paratrimastix pyriformis TaxID=342808 RepID=A0ABQ8UBY7_9EUKA|nr:putative DNA helicase MCM8 [Paratrimastix pyriformis]